MIRRPPRSTLFPYPTPFRSRRVMMRQVAGSPVRPYHLQEAEAHQIRAERNAGIDQPARQFEIGRNLVGVHQLIDEFGAHGADEDRKSTRLNSSHLVISYAVF